MSRMLYEIVAFLSIQKSKQNTQGLFDISKDYANSKEISVKNLIHASANEEDAKIEIPLWFNKDEMHSYKTVHDMICFNEFK